MNSPSPSTPPRGVRAAMPIEAMRRNPLSRYSRDEIERLQRLIRKVTQHEE
jgi:hypothetical protein